MDGGLLCCASRGCRYQSPVKHSVLGVGRSGLARWGVFRNPAVTNIFQHRSSKWHHLESARHSELEMNLTLYLLSLSIFSWLPQEMTAVSTA